MQISSSSQESALKAKCYISAIALSSKMLRDAQMQALVLDS